MPDKTSSDGFNLNIERPRSLAVSVAQTIEDAIAKGEIAPGSQIVESRLCEQINVSRGTLREALRLLQDRGLIEVVPHRGAIVSSLNAKKAQEIYTLRMLLEPYAVRLSMEQGAYTPMALDELQRALRRMYDLADRNNPSDVIEADMEFHRLLCCHCDHEMLLTMLEGLHLQTRRFILFTKLYQSDLKTEAETHLPIWEALQSGDVSLTETALRSHIREAGELLVKKMMDMERET